MPKKDLRIAVLSCTHCGNIWGLTPPTYQVKPSGAAYTELEKKRENKRISISDMQRRFWTWYRAALKKHGPYDWCIGNGDLIDGRGERQGSQDVHLIHTDEQVECAVRVLQETAADKYAITYGTPYHTGMMSDHEEYIAVKLKAERDDRLQIKFNGTMFDFKHEPSGRSGIPHGRHTAIARDNLWNELRAARGKEERADVTVRSHVHYYAFSGGAGWLGMTTPCLQLTSLYGKRRCHDDIDVGITVFDITKKGNYTWVSELMPRAQPQPLQITA